MSELQTAVSDSRKADADLIARCRAGEADAWDALFDKYYPVAARFVFQLSADFNHEDTEEICQETFLAVVRNLASFQGKSSFQTWLLRVAANKALDVREKNLSVRTFICRLTYCIMPLEPKKPIEELLETSAGARRAEFGADPKMPNPMRAQLHHEIARLARRDERKSRRRSFVLSWPG